MTITSNSWNYFLGESGSLYSNPDAFMFKSSIKLEVAFGAATAPGTLGFARYRIRKIK